MSIHTCLPGMECIVRPPGSETRACDPGCMTKWCPPMAGLPMLRPGGRARPRGGKDGYGGRAGGGTGHGSAESESLSDPDSEETEEAEECCWGLEIDIGESALWGDTESLCCSSDPTTFPSTQGSCSDTGSLGGETLLSVRARSLPPHFLMIHSL